MSHQQQTPFGSDLGTMHIQEF